MWRAAVLSFLVVIGVQAQSSSCGDDGCDGPSITDVEILDGGSDSAGSFSIDSTQDDCDPDGAVEDFEAFSDTYLKVKLNNDSYLRLRIRRVRFAVFDIGSGAREFRSERIVPSSGSTVFEGATGHTVLTFLTDVSGADKYFVGDTRPMTSRTGLKEIRIRLSGITDTGARVTLRSKVTVSIDNFDNCGG